MDEQPNQEKRGMISRRAMLQATLAAGVALSGAAADRATTATMAQAPGIVKEPGEPINVAVIGVGAMGQVLVDACLFKDAPIPNVRFKAICDIWPYNRKRAGGALRARGHQVNQYEDYREMLATEKDLHAVLIATPDWMHAEQTNACLEAGLHVYCEKEMANTLEGAASMVRTARKTGKLLQIGHQRRSNPRYLAALEKIVNGNRLLGRVGEVNAQWNRSIWSSQDLVCPKKIEIPEDVLKKYGYGSMHELLNWRWYKKYGSGTAVDLGGHQLDVVNWFLGAPPKSMTAIGSHIPGRKHDWCDNVMCLLEYETAAGPVNAFYQVLSDSSFNGFRETFLGEEGTLVMSEDSHKTLLKREAMSNRDWRKFEKEKWIAPNLHPPYVDPRADDYPNSNHDEWLLKVELPRPVHQPHLENFFEAIRKGTPLACPAEQAYATAVVTLAINRAVEAREKIVFKKEEFVV